MTFKKWEKFKQSRKMYRTEKIAQNLAPWNSNLEAKWMVQSQQNSLERIFFLCSWVIWSSTIGSGLLQKLCICLYCCYPFFVNIHWNLSFLGDSWEGFSFMCLFWIALSLFSSFSSAIPMLHSRNSSKLVKCINSTHPCFPGPCFGFAHF